MQDIVGSILQSLFGTEKARLFRANSWPDQPVVHHGSITRLPSVFRSGPLSSFESLAATVESDAGDRGISIPSSGFKGDVHFAGSRGQQHRYSVRAASASRLLRAGLNVSFSEFSVASAEPWVASFANQVGISRGDVRFYAFAAPSGDGNGAGTDPHWDPNEVIHIQLEGTKTFRLAPNAHTIHPDVGLNAGGACSEDLVNQVSRGIPHHGPRRWRSIIVRPGSVIYIPRGYWHETSTKGPSFAVSLGFYWPTAADLVATYVRARCRQDAAWRQPQFGLLKTGLRRIHERRLAHLMHQSGISTATFPPSDAMARVMPREDRIALRGRSGRYVRLPFSILARSQPDGTFAVQVLADRGAKSVTFSASSDLLRTLRWISRRREPFTLGELERAAKAMAPSDLATLVGILVEHDAVQIDSRSDSRTANHR